jgi:hypothetical protein
MGDLELSLRLVEIVKEFVITRKLIVYGGLAIDLALRLQGKKIYEDDVIWDIDVYSPQADKDAFDLVDLLKSMQFPRVSAFLAMHIQTMKVSVNYLSCADISYMPKEIFDKLPTLTTKTGIRILHPHYQCIDIHSSLHYPFSNAPSENLFNRYEKDVKRYNIIMQSYPLNLECALTKADKALNVKTFDMPSYKEFAFTGDVAFNVITHYYNEIRSTFKLPADKLLQFDIGISETKIRLLSYSGKMEVVVPDSIPIDTYYNCYMEQIEEYVGVDDKITYYVGNVLPTVSNVVINDVKFHIISIQGLMKHYLAHYYKTGDEMYMKYYCRLYIMIRDVELIFEDIIEANPSDKDDIIECFVNSPFSLSINTIGTKNISNNYIKKLASSINTCKDTESHIPEALTLLKNIPKAYKPHKSRPEEFDYMTNLIFYRIGQSVGHKV